MWPLLSCDLRAATDIQSHGVGASDFRCQVDLVVRSCVDVEALNIASTFKISIFIQENTNCQARATFKGILAFG